MVICGLIDWILETKPSSSISLTCLVLSRFNLLVSFPFSSRSSCSLKKVKQMKQNTQNRLLIVTWCYVGAKNTYQLVSFFLVKVCNIKKDEINFPLFLVFKKPSSIIPFLAQSFFCELKIWYVFIRDTHLPSSFVYQWNWLTWFSIWPILFASSPIYPLAPPWTPPINRTVELSSPTEISFQCLMMYFLISGASTVLLAVKIVSLSDLIFVCEEAIF